MQEKREEVAMSRLDSASRKVNPNDERSKSGQEETKEKQGKENEKHSEMTRGELNLER